MARVGRDSNILRIQEREVMKSLREEYVMAGNPRAVTRKRSEESSRLRRYFTRVATGDAGNRRFCRCEYQRRAPSTRPVSATCRPGQGIQKGRKGVRNRFER